MKPKILLVVPPIIYTRQPSIGTAYISGLLRDRGYEVKVRDLNTEITVFNDGDDLFWSQFDNQETFFYTNKNLFEKWTREILDYDPQIIGFSIWTTSIYNSLRLSAMIKQINRTKLIVFGGFLCSIEGRRLISYPQVDAVVYGEGEETIAEFAGEYNSTGYIRGCIFKRNGKIIDGGLRPEIHNLDKLPFPDFSDFQLDRYVFKNYLPISFSRGCQWRCRFCSVSNLWRSFRSRSADNIFQEILYRLKEFPTLEQFEICDPAFNQDLDTVSQLCELIIENELDIRFSGLAQIRPKMDCNFLKKMRKAGFLLCNYGVESGSQKVLKSMGKEYTPDEAERIIKDTYNAGIRVVLNFIVGYPEETDYDFKQTLNFIERIKDYILNIAPAHPCDIEYSYIQKHPEEFNINFLNDSIKFWRTQDREINYLKRQQRAKAFNDFCNDLGISLRCGEDDREMLKDVNKTK